MSSINKSPGASLVVRWLFVVAVTFLPLIDAIAEPIAEPMAEPNPEPVRIAVRAYSGLALTHEKWDPTIAKLNSDIPEYNFELVPMVGFAEMRSAVANQTVAFVLVNPMTYVELVQKYGVRRLVTLQNIQNEIATSEFAAVIFSRADRPDLAEVSQFRGYSIMGVAPEAFGGWRMAMMELHGLGIDPWRDFSEVLFAPDGTQQSVVRAVLNGDVDIGTVRTGIIESMVERGELSADSLQLLNQVNDAGQFSRSTKLYPEWPLAAVVDTPTELAQKVALVLLAMTPEDEAAKAGGYHGWIIPMDYSVVRELMETLQLLPFLSSGQQTFKEYLHRYENIVFPAVSVFVVVLVFNILLLVTLNRRLRLAKGDVQQQHNRLERLVKQRTAELQSLFEAADNVAFVSAGLEEPNAVIFGFSPGAEKIYGYSADEVIGQTTMTLVPPGDVEKFMNITEILNRGERWYEGDITLVRKSGESFPASLTINPLFDESGNRVGSLGVTIDNSERKFAEMALAETQSRFEVITNEAIEGITVADLAGKYIFVNRAFCEMMGYSRETLLKMTVFDVKAKNQDHSSFERSKTTEEGDPFQVVLERKDGSEFISEVLGKVVEINGEQCVLGIVRDITVRTEAEEALRESEERLVEAQKAAKLGHYILDLEKGTWTSSVGLDDVFEMDQNFERNITAWLNIVHPDFREDMTAYFQNHVMTQHKKFDREYKILGVASGREKWVHGWGDLIFDDENNPIEMFGVIQDITEKVKLEEQLRQAQKMESIGRLAGGVAHDFNNMLGVILGHAELAMDQVDSTQPLHTDLQEIRSAARRSADLTRQLLGFARKQTISPIVLDINATVAGMLNMLGRLIGEDIALVWRPDSEVWPIRVDPSQVDQILVNLCVNSRDAIAGVGEVSIKTSNITFDEAFCADHLGFKPGDYVVLSVGDNGSGMDEEIKSRLYEPFFTTKSVGEGTGLGLAMVYGIVKQNKGFIDVYSEPGEGTLFKIYLPRQDAIIGLDLQADVELEPVRGHETILLVEDEPLVLDLVTRVITSLGYTVLAAASPREAIKLAAAHGEEISLLCTDVVMPGMNGMDLVKKLKLSRPGLNCLFMSGYAADVLKNNETLTDEILFIQKPFTKKDIAVKLREILDAT